MIANQSFMSLSTVDQTLLKLAGSVSGATARACAGSMRFRRDLQLTSDFDTLISVRFCTSTISLTSARLKFHKANARCLSSSTLDVRFVIWYACSRYTARVRTISDVSRFSLDTHEKIPTTRTHRLVAYRLTSRIGSSPTERHNFR
jgi:hypothetical protein